MSQKLIGHFQSRSTQSWGSNRTVIGVERTSISPGMFMTVRERTKRWNWVIWHFRKGDSSEAGPFKLSHRDTCMFEGFSQLASLQAIALLYEQLVGPEMQGGLIFCRDDLKPKSIVSLCKKRRSTMNLTKSYFLKAGPEKKRSSVKR